MTQTFVVVAALFSAFAAAASSVLQHRSARRAPHDQTHRLLAHLLVQPAWIAGLLSAGLGLALHAVALADGQLAVVQPLLISGMLFALPVSALLENRRPSWVEWVWALILVTGLAVFLVAARPHTGRVALDADVLAWATFGGLLLIGLVTLVGMRWPHGHAPLLLGAAAGIGYGLDAALLKQTTAIYRSGVIHLLTDWPLYAFVAVGVASLALTQMAYRLGSLASSLPALTISDPAVSIALGALAFREGLANDPVSLVSQIAGFLVMAVAARQLARREKATEPVSNLTA